MINKRIIAAGFLIAGLLVALFNGKTKLGDWHFSGVDLETSPPINFIVNSPETKPPSTSEIQAPSTRPNRAINPDKILSYLENLVGERYTERDREFIRNYLIKELEEFGFSPGLQTFERGVNIVAKKPGSDPRATTLLLGAHYDTVLNSPGADDNASGVAVLLEIARLFGSQPTANTLELVFFDQEEPGLLGSFAFTSLPENLENLRHVIVLDMVGYACRIEGCQQYPPGLNVGPLLRASGVSSPDKGEFLAVVGEAQHRDLLAAFREISPRPSELNLPPVVPVPIPLKGALTPDVLRSDHAPFWYQNIPAVLITDTANLRSPYYHQPTDTLNSLDREFLMGSAQVIVDVVSRLLEN